MESLFDVTIIGGGINGCSCAADAAQRGLKVLLCEQSDLGSKTSSSSSKLIHGGLRYLENGDVLMVHKALKERKRLLDIAPHLINPAKFILTNQNRTRPNWLIKIGLSLYDNLLLKKHLPKSQAILHRTHPEYFTPLKPEITKAFIYSDCITDDSRLVIENAIQAKNYGAKILPRTKLIHSQISNNIWELALQDNHGKIFQVKSKSIINATGPWVESVNDILRVPLKQKISKVKGSHIVVPSLYDGEQVYVLQCDDKRIIFVIPFYGHSLIGTTEIKYEGSLTHVNILNEEIDYLLNLVNSHFNKNTTKEDIVHHFSGVRPLLYTPNKEARELSRDFSYDFMKTPAPLITIYGGKITTYRVLGEKVVDALSPIFFKLPKSNTASVKLPGAYSTSMHYHDYLEYARKKYSWMNPNLLNRYLKTYGARCEVLLKDCVEYEDLGLHFGDNLYQLEVDYLIKHEWAMKKDDILLRRTKLGLIVSDQTHAALQEYLNSIFKRKSRDIEQESVEI